MSRIHPLQTATVILAGLWIGTPLARAAEPVAVPLHVQVTPGHGGNSCRMTMSLSGAAPGVTIARMALKFEIGTRLGTAYAELIEPGRWRQATVAFQGYCDRDSRIRIIGASYCTTIDGAPCMPVLAAMHGTAKATW